MTKDELHAIGQALFGSSWQSSLARAIISPHTGLPINDRTVRRWASGKSAIPDWLPERLNEIKKQRIEEFKRLSKTLK